MPRERKKFAVVMDETLRAEEANGASGGNGDVNSYRLKVIERWIVNAEEDIEGIKANQTWWMGAAAASGLLLGVVSAVLMAIFIWALGLIKLGG